MRRSKTKPKNKPYLVAVGRARPSMWLGQQHARPMQPRDNGTLARSMHLMFRMIHDYNWYGPWNVFNIFLTIHVTEHGLGRERRYRGLQLTGGCSGSRWSNAYFRQFRISILIWFEVLNSCRSALRYKDYKKIGQMGQGSSVRIQKIFRRYGNDRESLQELEDHLKN